jgi:hypothetical protein
MLSNWPIKYDEIVRVRALPPAKAGGGGCVPPAEKGGRGGVGPIGSTQYARRRGGVGPIAQHSEAAVG